MVIAKRAPILAEQIAGLSTIFGGTVIGWETEAGKKLVGSLPAACISEIYDWQSASTSTCSKYRDVAAVLFRVDTPIVGPEAGAIIHVCMTWGDGDCNFDFNWGSNGLSQL